MWTVVFASEFSHHVATRTRAGLQQLLQARTVACHLHREQRPASLAPLAPHNGSHLVLGVSPSQAPARLVLRRVVGELHLAQSNDEQYYQEVAPIIQNNISKNTFCSTTDIGGMD